MLRRAFVPASCLVSPLILALACGGDPDVANGSGGGFAANAGQGGSSGEGASDAGGNGGEAGTLILPDGGGSGGTGGAPDPCQSVNCPDTQRCEAGACVANECGDLNCGPQEICEETADGARCKDVSCSEQSNCEQAQYCDPVDGICKDDVCVAGETTCMGDTVLQCDPFGGGEEQLFGCMSGSPYFTSECSDMGSSGQGACTCEDDWDCPRFTDCEAGECQGTGTAPTCALPPADFSSVPPANEITWGGAGVGSENAPADVPFPASAQVVLTPIVANLDDDNGDGAIDERDFPEIIFTTFEGQLNGVHDFKSNGTLRAIHGGGVNKGKDFFANCAGTLWQEGDDPTAVSCNRVDADLDSTASLAVGDLDYDGIPEIVAITEDDEVRIYSNRGAIIATAASTGLGGGNPAPTLANLDNQGHAEIIVGRDVFTLETDTNNNLVFLDHFEGGDDDGSNGQGPVSCVANLVGDARQEIVAGTTAYRYPVPPAGVTRRADCSGSETDADEVAWCNGQLPELWDAPSSDGFCAIADIWGATQDAASPPGPNNPLDGRPEVILVRAGSIDVIDGVTGNRFVTLNINGDRGGAPNIDDFDGDGYPEVGTAGSTRYVLTDFQAPTANCPEWSNVNDSQSTLPRNPPSTSCATDSDCGDTSQFACNATTSECVCLHNGWKRATEDDSSEVTGSSVFDFNGDGAAEVVYNDECFFRVYDGRSGDTLFDFPSESRTRIEYPVVADVDNDGNAEIVFSTTNESGFCADGRDQASYNNGIEVWGEANDLWVSARRIWNQHAYHITNVTESGHIPRFEPESWGTYNGRIYNSYRSNPRSFGVAPDLVIQSLQVSSPGSGCDELTDQIDISVQVSNIGDLRVGPGVEIAFEGTWPGPLVEPLATSLGGPPLTATITNSLEPGDVLIVKVSYDAASNSPGVLPDSITARVDSQNQERECEEANNEASTPVESASELPDLRIELGAILASTCPTPDIPTTVINDGTAEVSNVVVRYYRGDPSLGLVLDEVTVPGPIPPNGGTESFTHTLTTFPPNSEILVVGVVDPDNLIEECNDGNNDDAADNKVICGAVQ